ncbi:MAG: hypothetical protein GQ570_10160 [Helicobacteraceae bacterium]|nr:hypothetical protein [Helicobacteraceae bacterium]
MKLIILIFAILSYTLACTGDCMSCHPALKENILNDDRHVAMLGCIKCHKADPESMAECGSDCYSCHNVEKMSKQIKEHEVIVKCRDCHMKLKEKAFSVQEPAYQSSKKVLKDFLFK